MTPAISTQDLGKTYRVGFFMRRVEGLRDLTLTVNPGEAFDARVRCVWIDVEGECGQLSL